MRKFYTSPNNVADYRMILKLIVMLIPFIFTPNDKIKELPAKEDNVFWVFEPQFDVDTKFDGIWNMERMIF